MQNLQKKLHLINQKTLTEKKLDPEELKSFMDMSNMLTLRKEYHVVSIIGSQSTGKSTLLNKVFGTEFDVQVRGKSLGQTTIGIWLSKDATTNCLVLDVEGSDSVERKISDSVIENQTALFALAMSHAFIINVFLNSLGQHTSCQLSIIKVIMQMNLKLFKQDTVKNIIFVIRDWEEEASYDDAFNRVTKYLLDIWKDIPKPEEMTNTPFEQLFNVQVVTLCYFKMKEFNDQTQTLHKRLTDAQDKDFLFKNFDKERNLPIDAMPQYLSNIWDTIANNKDLNLPNEKILVANLRCQQIKQESYDLVLPKLESLSQQSSEKLQENFSSLAKEIIDQSLDKYNNETRDYAKEVVQEKRMELESVLLNFLHACFQKQVEIIKRQFSNDLSTELDNLKEVEDIFILPETIIKLRNDLPYLFGSQIDKLVIKPDLWNEGDFTQNFLDGVSYQIDNFIENQMSIHFQKLDKRFKNLCENRFNELLGEADFKFWGNLQSWLEKLLITNYNKYEKLLSDFDIPDMKKEKFLKSFEKDVYENLLQVVRAQSVRFKEILFQKFKKLFNSDENGQPRDWQKLTEEEIMHVYSDAKENTLKLLEYLKYHEINTKSVVQIKSKRATQSMIGKSIQREEVAKLDIECVVLSEIQCQQIRSQLSEEFETIFNDAITKHRATMFQNIPKWFWFILLFFMYDDILRWIGQPIFLYPILMLICFVGFCIAIGYHNLPMLLFQQFVKTAQAQIMPIFFKGISKIKQA